MPIDKIIIDNFRSWEHAEIDLSPGLTAICGNPQSGKTNGIRGIEFLRTNRPLGNKFVPRFNKKASPSVKIIADGNEISITKKKTKSIYNLNGQEFYSGGDVPSEIEEVLNLGDTNIQGQIEKPFIITDTPGEVIKAINKITKLEKVDLW